MNSSVRKDLPGHSREPSVCCLPEHESIEWKILDDKEPRLITPDPHRMILVHNNIAQVGKSEEYKHRDRPSQRYQSRQPAQIPGVNHGRNENKPQERKEDFFQEGSL